MPGQWKRVRGKERRDLRSAGERNWEGEAEAEDEGSRIENGFSESVDVSRKEATGKQHVWAEKVFLEWSLLVSCRGWGCLCREEGKKELRIINLGEPS